MAVPTYGWSLEKQAGSVSLHSLGRPRLNCSGETNGTFPAPFAGEPPFRCRPISAVPAIDREGPLWVEIGSRSSSDGRSK